MVKSADIDRLPLFVMLTEPVVNMLLNGVAAVEFLGSRLATLNLTVSVDVLLKARLPDVPPTVTRAGNKLSAALTYWKLKFSKLVPLRRL